MERMERFLIAEEPGLGLEEARHRLESLVGAARDRWCARLMREVLPSRFFGAFLAPKAVNRDYERLRPFLGRARPLWDWVILGGRAQGLLPEPR